MRRLLLFIFMFFMAAPAYADSARDTLSRINSCIKTSDVKRCRSEITTASLAMYDRFGSYDIVDCLPKDITYVSEQRAGSQVVLRASTGKVEKQRFMRLAFIEEAGKWRLDIPASMRIGMGENWKKQVNFAEQLYLVLREQMGGKLNCAAVQEIVDNIPRKKKSLPEL